MGLSPGGRRVFRALLFGVVVAACQARPQQAAAPRATADALAANAEASQAVPEPANVDEAFLRLRSPNSAERLAGLRHLCWRLPIAGREDETIRLIQPMLVDGDAILRELATTAIGQMGSAAAPAVPTLLDVVRSGSEAERAHAAQALRRIGLSRDMREPLLAAIDSTTVPKFRADLVLTLGEVPGPPEFVIRQLAVLIRDPNLSVRQAARAGLIRAGPSAAIVVPELIDALETPACEDAATVLANLGSAAGAAVPALFGLLDEAPQCNARQVAAAIHAIRGEAVQKGVPR